MRDFLFSDIAATDGLANLPDNPELAIAAGTRLCVNLLQRLQDQFGRMAIRSARRSCEINALGAMLQASGKKGYNCAANEENYASHIRDRRDGEDRMGATACVPALVDAFPGGEGWRKLAWWIHDHLPYSRLEFFPTLWAFNIRWREQPERRIDSYAAPPGCLTKTGMMGHSDGHEAEWAGIERATGK